VTWRVTLVLPALSLAAVPLCLRAAAQRRGSGQPSTSSALGISSRTQLARLDLDSASQHVPEATSPAIPPVRA